jgi:hypothetical protein
MIKASRMILAVSYSEALSAKRFHGGAICEEVNRVGILVM